MKKIIGVKIWPLRIIIPGIIRIYNKGYKVNDIANQHSNDDGSIKNIPHFSSQNPAYGVFSVIDEQERSFKNNQLYLVFSEYAVGEKRMHIYSEPHNEEETSWRGLGEFYQEEKKNGINCLKMGSDKYAPRVHDSHNEERKEIFRSCYTNEYQPSDERDRNLFVYIPINENFLDEVFEYAECRFKATYLIS